VGDPACAAHALAREADRLVDLGRWDGLAAWLARLPEEPAGRHRREAWTALHQAQRRVAARVMDHLAAAPPRPDAAGPVPGRPPAPTLTVHLLGRLRVRLNGVAVDDRLERSGEQAGAIAACELARSLYNGDLLADAPYEEWSVLPRERLRQAHLDLLDRLSRLYFDQGRYAASAALCRRVVELDPCREDVHQRLIRCYSRQGRPYLALRQYRACAAALRAELDVDPRAPPSGFRRRCGATRPSSPGVAVGGATAAPACATLRRCFPFPGTFVTLRVNASSIRGEARCPSRTTPTGCGWPPAT
jgi:Bacterial transcriptional activator domain